MSGPAKAVKKPVEIEAWKLSEDNAAEVMSWASSYGHKMFTVAGGVNIWTLEGVHLAKWGDWVIKGVQNEFYPCKPEIFADTYEVL